MEYTNEVLQGMKEKKALYNQKFSRWYYGMYQESGGAINRKFDDGRLKVFPDGGVQSLFNKGDRIANCCDLWVWDKYERNKLLDLKRLNRCMNSRFCPNCMMMNTAKFIHEVKTKLPDLLDEFDCYLLTLTVPSEHCDGKGLRMMIDKLYSSFRKLNHKFSMDLYTPTGRPSSQALQERYLRVAGGVRVLEITVSTENGFHPHLHCLILVRKGSIKPYHLEKLIEGKWSYKRESFNMKSDIDMQIGKAWSMIWHGISFKKWDRVEYSAKDVYLQIDDEVTEFKNLEVDFAEMDDNGLYEVIKYIYKPGDVSTYSIFKTMVEALANKRIRQGFGVLYDLKCDDDIDGEKQPLELEIEESPVELVTREFDELLSAYSEYRKVSRFNPAQKDVINRLAEI